MVAVMKVRRWKMMYLVTHEITLFIEKILLRPNRLDMEGQRKSRCEEDRKMPPTLPKSPRLSSNSLKSRSTFACSCTCSCDRIRSFGTVSKHSAPSAEFSTSLDANSAEPLPSTCPGRTSWKRTPFSCVHGWKASGDSESQPCDLPWRSMLRAWDGCNLRL